MYISLNRKDIKHLTALLFDSGFKSIYVGVRGLVVGLLQNTQHSLVDSGPVQKRAKGQKSTK